MATFPFVHVDNDSGVWKAKIYFNPQLYSYQYPFLFPKSYLSYQDKYDMQIKLQIMQSFANTSLKKKFNVLEFMDRFQNTPNKPRLQKTLYIELKQLTPLLIGNATTLYYFEII